MLAPKSWLSEFVDLKGISDELFAREMTFAGNKVESVQKINGEVVYEFEITSNRPDTLSVIGLARETAAVFSRQLKLPTIPSKNNLKKKPISLAIADKKICPVVSMVEIDNVTVKSSSKLIQKRLELVGIRPVNNVVDITNYLMLETGQPMHAFDADKLKGNLIIRPAKSKEKITPLDHKQRVLQGGEIIIEDNEKLIDLAGLMGGLNSEISNKTKRVYLLVPIYDPISIRRASKYLRLRTEASTRFEKKLDLTQTESVTLRAIELLEKETGGRQTTKIVTSEGSDLAGRSDPSRYIELTPDAVTKLVGIPFAENDINRLLAKIGVRKTSHGYLIPSWRRDINIPVDLVEEVARLYGYNKFKRTLPSGEIPINPDALTPNWKRIVADHCATLGYTETYASTLIGKSQIEELGFYSPEQHLKVLHPMSTDFEYMRRTTLETMIPFLKQNLIQTDKVNLFELGTVFIPNTKTSELPDQPLELGLISTTSSFAEFKGQINSIGKAMGVSLEFSPSGKTNLGPMTNLVLIIDSKDEIGQIGQVDSAYAGYLNMTQVFKHATQTFQYPQLSGYPSIVEDLTLERPEEKYLGDVLTTIKNISPLVQGVDFLGEYQNFVTLRVTYQSFDRSLTQEEVSAIRKELLKKLEIMGWKLKI